MSSTPLERRASRSALELREADGTGGSLHGFAILFNTPSQDLGGFKETIAAGAVDLTTDRDVRFLVGHDDSQILGRTKNHTLSLAIEERGVRFDLALPDTQLAKDTRELVKLGTLDAMSFGFRTLKDSWSPDKRARTVERLQLFEISAVAFPAYEGSVIEAREVIEARARTLKALRAMPGSTDFAQLGKDLKTVRAAAQDLLVATMRTCNEYVVTPATATTPAVTGRGMTDEERDAIQVLLDEGKAIKAVLDEHQRDRRNIVAAQLEPHRVALALAEHRHAITRAALGWAPGS